MRRLEAPVAGLSLPHPSALPQRDGGTAFGGAAVAWPLAARAAASERADQGRDRRSELPGMCRAQKRTRQSVDARVAVVDPVRKRDGCSIWGALTTMRRSTACVW